MEKHIVAKPMNELAVRNAKYAAECTELHLAHRNISVLADRQSGDSNEFDRFINLEVLWCNHNQLTRLDGLDMNFRIKHIYAHNNKIATLKDSSIVVMTFLHTLNLASNNLSDLKVTLDVLQRQKHLKELNLNDNPIAEEKDFRLHVIKKLPWLEVLDNHRVSQEDIDNAKKLRSLDDQPNVTFDILGTAQLTQVSPDTSPSTMETRAIGLETDHNLDNPSQLRTVAFQEPNRLKQLLLDMRRKVKEKRICLKLHFLEMDPRNEEVLRDDAVIEVLHMYGMWPQGGVLPWKGPSVYTELQQQFLNRYAVDPPKRASYGRDVKVVDGHMFIDYVKLCREMEPESHGRDLDESERKAALNWNKKMPEKTKVTLMLEKEMSAYLAETQLKEEKRKLEMIGLNDKEDTNTTPMMKAYRHSDRHAPSLSPWEVHALWHFLDDLDKVHAANLVRRGFDAKPCGKLRRSDLVKGLEQMEYMGRLFGLSPQGVEPALDPMLMTAVERREMLDKIFSAFEQAEEIQRAKEIMAKPPPSTKGKKDKSAPPTPTGGKASKAQSAVAAAALLSEGNDPPEIDGLDWRVFLKGVVNGVTDPDTQLIILRPLMWWPLPRDLCLEKSADLFQQANQLQRRVLTGHESADDVHQIGEMMIHATRLEELAGAPTSPEESTADETIPEAIAAAVVAANSASNSKISGMGTLATVTGALLKFKSKIHHTDTPREEDLLSSEQKEARRLNLLRKKFRLTKAQVEEMSR